MPLLPMGNTPATEQPERQHANPGEYPSNRIQAVIVNFMYWPLSLTVGERINYGNRRKEIVSSTSRSLAC